MGKSILLRPIRPDDGEMHQRFFKALDPTDVHSRMFVQMRELQPALLARMTHIDYDREMAFIAVSKDTDGKDETLGVVRAIADPDNENAEFAIVVRSDLKGKGLGYVLMKKLVDYFQRRGTRRIVGETLATNHALLQLAKEFGFRIQTSSSSESLMLALDLEKY